MLLEDPVVLSGEIQGGKGEVTPRRDFTSSTDPVARDPYCVFRLLYIGYVFFMQPGDILNFR